MASEKQMNFHTKKYLKEYQENDIAGNWQSHKTINSKTLLIRVKSAFQVKKQTGVTKRFSLPTNQAATELDK